MQVEVGGARDEIAALAEAFNEMVREVREGRVVQIALPDRPLVVFQVVEYLRAFLAGWPLRVAPVLSKVEPHRMKGSAEVTRVRHAVPTDCWRRTLWLSIALHPFHC